MKDKFVLRIAYDDSIDVVNQCIQNIGNAYKNYYSNMSINCDGDLCFFHDPVELQMEIDKCMDLFHDAFDKFNELKVAYNTMVKEESQSNPEKLLS